MTTANNAPLTNQGRADLRRVPTESQIAFNDHRSSAISVVSNARLGAFTSGIFGFKQFTPTVSTTTPPPQPVERRLCVFLWMTDRITAVSAEQFFPGVLHAPIGNDANSHVGDNLCSCVSSIIPTNGFALLPAGASCTATDVTETGAQSTLAYQTASVQFAVRGTPLLLTMSNPGYRVPSIMGLVPALPFVSVSALSESILSGRAGVQVRGTVGGVYNAYTGTVNTRRQTILLIDDYLTGRFWEADNVLVDAAGNVFDIVGVYAEPPYLIAS